MEWDGRRVRLGPSTLRNDRIEVAGDFSAAAFFITAAAVTPGSAIVVRRVGVNATRTGLLDALRAMGAAIELRDARTACGEPVADVAVQWRQLTAAAVDAATALRAIDEIPLLALAGAFARGVTTIAGVADLRTKESDRIAAIERLLGTAGIEAGYERGVLRVTGGIPAAQGRRLATDGDHRIAMAGAVLGCGAGPVVLDEAESFGVSFPGFVESLAACGQARSGCRLGRLCAALGVARCARVALGRGRSRGRLVLGLLRRTAGAGTA